MNSNKCEHIMDSFYSLDKGERLPLSSSMHLLFCKECRTKVRLLSKAEQLVKRPLREIKNFEDDQLSEMIKNTTPGWMQRVKPVSMKKWVFGGLLMTIFFIFGGHFISLSENQNYILFFYLIFAAAISGYCAAFVAVNMDFFIKKIDTKKSV